MRYIPLMMILSGLLCAMIAALQPISLLKGKARLVSSFLVAGGIFLSGAVQIPIDHRPWPGGLLPLGAVFLAWIGWWKFERDPEGRTSASKIL